MRAFPALLALLLALLSPVRAQDDAGGAPLQMALWRSGSGGYHTYRIPALVATPRGTLLAFCEGRRGGRGDSGDIDLLCRRSSDGGRTWSPAALVWDDGSNTCGNPCPVVDRERGVVHLLMTRNLGADHEAAIIAGKSRGTRTVWVCSSADEGMSWSAPREITAAVKRSEWTWYATGPGKGIQLRMGAHRSRLVVPCDHIEKGTRRYYSHIIYSDDHGKSWKLGGSSPADQLNECQVAELSDGRLVLNMRSYDRRRRCRTVCFSADGGASWTDLRREEKLIEPICQAGLTSYRHGRLASSALLLFSNPASEQRRERLSVRLSRDDGRTWPQERVLHAGPAAYSSLEVLPGGALGCLYECGRSQPYETITFARLEPRWLGIVEPPNVVLVLVDDLGWSDLGCTGGHCWKTPNADRLALEGLRFTRAYASCAVCSPTRAAVLTGRYPARIGITDWIRARFQGGAVPADGKAPSGYTRASAKHPLECPRNPLWMELSEVTLAEALGAADYRSCAIGKWHLGAEPWYPERQGFDLNLGGCDFGQPPSYFDPYFRKGQGRIPTLAPRREGEYLTDREGDEAVRFLRANRERPFFLYLAHYAVHTPLMAPAELIASLRGPAAARGDNPTYAAMVERVDQALGRVLATLRELNLEERTLVIFTSDNGGLLGPTSNAPLRAGKGFPYEGGIRVPLIVRWPGVVPAGVISAEPVASIDLLPTILEAVARPLPAGRAIDGRSLLAHLRTGGAQPLERAALFWHFPHYRGRKIGPYSIAMAGRWKLIRWWQGPRHELYDLKADPGEKRNLAAEQPQRAAALARLLDEHLARVGARLPRSAPR